MSVVTHVDLSGPFFQRDPARTMWQNVRKMMAGVAEEGERVVRANYPVLTGFGQAGVVGRVRSLSGRPWAATAVVSQTRAYPWHGGGPKQYRGGKSEARHHMFRAAYRDLQHARAVLGANLTQGLE
jgi:hypothetical protein